MILKKILPFLLCLIMFAGITPAQNKLAKLINGWKYEIPKTTVVPVIDGIQDPVWKALDWNFLTSYDNNTTAWDDWFDLFGATKLMYDDDNLYCLFWTQDDDPVGNDAASVNWQRNAVEIYFDGDNSKDCSGTVSAPDHHLTFRHEHIGNEAISNWDVETGLDSTGFEWILRDDETISGYWLEFKIPLESIDMPNTAGSVIGLEFQQDDNDGNGREAVSKWWADEGDSAWQYACTWGTGELTDKAADGKFIIMKAPAGSAPVVDGNLDDVFLAGNSTTTNNFGNISIDAPVYPDDFTDAFLRTYLLYDDDNLYGYLEVYDDDPVGNDAAVVNWQRNAVELYLDGDNSKDCSGTVAAPDHHLTFRHEHIDNEGVSNWDVETGLDSVGFEWKITDFTKIVGKDDFEVTGYSVEFKIPLESVEMPNTEGSVVGLELQQDDNDGAGRDVVTKWWEDLGDSSWQYACSWGTAVLGGEVVVGVDGNTKPVPTSFSLSQNYPNPFNPSTKISFSVIESGLVTLKIYNVLGQEIATLINNELTSGVHEVEFSASNLPSGVYIYKLENGNSSITKKMMLLK